MLNWARRVMADGVVFYPPEGREGGGALRVRAFVRPLRRLREVRADHLARLAPLGEVELTAPTHEVTQEGEHAVLYAGAARGATQVTLHVGITFGDDGYLLVEGLCGDPALDETFAAATRRLTLGLPLGLGADRRRRYRYQRPPGWHPIVKRHEVVWYPVDFPRVHAAIHVFDAKPAQPGRANDLDRLVLMDPQRTLQSFTGEQVYSVLTDTGLRGAYEVLRGTRDGGTPAALVRATLTDGRFSYSLRLEAHEPGIDEAREHFDRVVRSVHPIPGPQVPQNPAMIHWTE